MTAVSIWKTNSGETKDKKIHENKMDKKKEIQRIWRMHADVCKNLPFVWFVWEKIKQVSITPVAY